MFGRTTSRVPTEAILLLGGISPLEAMTEVCSVLPPSVQTHCCYDDQTLGVEISSIQGSKIKRVFQKARNNIPAAFDLCFAPKTPEKRLSLGQEYRILELEQDIDFCYETSKMNRR